jgi:hypothetical protein
LEQLSHTFLDRVVTFAQGGETRTFPLDLMPLLLGAVERDLLSRGVAQRVRALEAFLGDVYGKGQVFSEGIIAKSVIASSSHICRAVSWCGPAGSPYPEPRPSPQRLRRPGPAAKGRTQGHHAHHDRALARARDSCLKRLGIPLPVEQRRRRDCSGWSEARLGGVLLGGRDRLDPTNAVGETERHIIVGRGRHYDDVVPLLGIYQGSVSSNLGVIVEMSRLF